MTKEDIIKELTKTGQLPVEFWGWQADCGGKSVMVEHWDLCQILRRLVSLREVSPKHLASGDIPMVIDYILKGIPKLDNYQ